jgi:hypothetical protein
MNAEKLIRPVFFLVVDGAIVLAIFLLVHLDWIVNNTLYSYGLRFDLDWAMDYWTALRVVLGLLGFSLAAISIMGYDSYRKAREESLRTVFICETCGSALTRLDGGLSLKESLPKLKVLPNCPLCDEKSRKK